MELEDDDWDLSAEDLDSLERNAIHQLSQYRSDPFPASPSPSASSSLSNFAQNRQKRPLPDSVINSSVLAPAGSCPSKVRLADLFVG